MRAAGLQEPVFTTTEPDGFFRAIFRRSPEFALKKGASGAEVALEKDWAKLAERLDEKLGERLGENELRVLQLIHRDRRISIPRMAKEIGISTTAVDKNLTKLKKKGVIRHVGPARGGHWEVME